MIDFCFDISIYDKINVKLVSSEIENFYTRYFPEFSDRNIKIIITENSVIDKAKELFQIAGLNGTVINLFTGSNTQGYGKEIDGIIFLIFDYKCVGFPYLYSHNDNYDKFWNDVKEYTLHHELQHIMNRYNYHNYFSLFDGTKEDFFYDMILDEYLAIYQSFMNLGKNGILKNYLEGGDAIEKFNKSSLKLYYNQFANTHERDGGQIEFIYNLAKLLAYLHASLRLNSQKYTFNFSKLPDKITQIFNEFDSFLFGFSQTKPELFRGQMIGTIEKLFSL